MTRDPIGFALSAMNRLAGLPLLDRLGVRKPVERLAYQGTRVGFQALTVANREFKRARDLFPRKRLPARRPGDLFDLNLDDDQQMIVDSLRRFASDVLRPNAAECDENAALPHDIEHQAQALGLSLYAVPAEFGGVAENLSPVTSVLIAEQLAWGDLGLAQALLAPFSVAQAITRWGTAEQQSTYLPAFCEDQPPVATIAIDEPVPLFDPMSLSTRATRHGDDFTLNGLKSGVVRAGDSDLYLVAAELDGEGPRVFLIERGTGGLAFEAEPAMGLRAAGTGRIRLDNVRLPASALLGDEDFNYSTFIDRGVLLRCGLAAGCAQAVQDYVIPYANEREAFGEPISHRQSVAFMISNMAIEIESMRLLTWRAASRAETGRTYHREACLARLLCSEKAMEVGTNGVQLLGGHGFVKEHPVERWYRDLRSAATLFGGTHA
ncbi:acyl-CoA dehydrogenase family protein [Marinobacter sp. NFXS9]|uniref:acyl-CoA dehydrogenase family protein n=1 Tax=Marinobacter sp. NFXS9 TaxID=2818433 RepID=UPI0032DE4A2C